MHLAFVLVVLPFSVIFAVPISSKNEPAHYGGMMREAIQQTFETAAASSTGNELKSLVTLFAAAHRVEKGTDIASLYSQFMESCFSHFTLPISLFINEENFTKASNYWILFIFRKLFANHADITFDQFSLLMDTPINFETYMRVIHEGLLSVKERLGKQFFVKATFLCDSQYSYELSDKENLEKKDLTRKAYAAIQGYILENLPTSMLDHLGMAFLRPLFRKVEKSVSNNWMKVRDFVGKADGHPGFKHKIKPVMAAQLRSLAEKMQSSDLIETENIDSVECSLDHAYGFVYAAEYNTIYVSLPRIFAKLLKDGMKDIFTYTSSDQMRFIDDVMIHEMGHAMLFYRLHKNSKSSELSANDYYVDLIKKTPKEKNQEFLNLNEGFAQYVWQGLNHDEADLGILRAHLPVNYVTGEKFIIWLAHSVGHENMIDLLFVKNFWPNNDELGTANNTALNPSLYLARYKKEILELLPSPTVNAALPTTTSSSESIRR